VHDCDFIPNEYRERQRVRRMVRHRAIAMASLFGVMIVWFLSNHYRLSSAQAMMTDVAAQKSELERVAAIRQDMEQARSVLQNLRQLLGELSGHRSLVPVFADLSRRIPDSIVLTACRLYEPAICEYAIPESEVGAVREGREALIRSRARAANAPKIDAGTMYRGLELIGVARTIPDIIEFNAALDRSPLFFHVTMEVKDPVIHLGQPARRFEIRCRLTPQREAGA